MLKRMIEDTIKRYLKEADKIWPLHKAIPVLIAFGAIAIIVMLALPYFEAHKTKRDFYPIELNMKLGQGVTTGRYMFYKINDEWYAIQGLINSKICPGDSISKEKDSFEIFVYHPDGSKAIYNYPRTTIKPVSQDSKIRRYFRFQADTINANFDCLDRRIE